MNRGNFPRSVYLVDFPSVDAVLFHDGKGKVKTKHFTWPGVAVQNDVTSWCEPRCIVYEDSTYPPAGVDFWEANQAELLGGKFAILFLCCMNNTLTSF